MAQPSSAKTLVKSYKSSLQSSFNSSVKVSTHFVERFIERVPLEDYKIVLSGIIKKIKNDLCVLVYESLKNGTSVRFRTAGYFVVCSFIEDERRLVLRTLYAQK